MSGLFRQSSLFLDDRWQNNWVDDKYDWTKELVVITGAGGSGGIANAVFKELSARGIEIVILDVNEPTTAYPRTHFCRCDLSSPVKVQNAISTIQEKHGHPTVLIHIAGTWNKTYLLETSDEATKHIFAVNVFAHYQFIRAFASSMVKNNHGMVVTATSNVAFGTAIPAMADYAAAKSGLISVHEMLGLELAVIYKAPKVRTVLVVPSFVKTTLAQGMQFRSGFWNAVGPEDMGKEVARQVDRAKWNSCVAKV